MHMGRLKRQLEKDEGRRAYVYKCTAGRNTIGIGRNIDDNPIKPSEWEFILGHTELVKPEQFLVDSLLAGDIGLTDKAIDHLFNNDLVEIEKNIRATFYWFEKLDDLRQEFLINFCFQIGFKSLCGFRKMLQALEYADFEEAGKEFQDSRYWREREEKGYKLRAERHLQTITGA